jgi:hypothetical protein
VKVATIILTGFMLLLGLETASAATGDHTGHSAISPYHSALLLEDPVDSATPPLDVEPNLWINSDEEMFASPSLTVWDYVISPQVTLDLQCRAFSPEPNAAEFISDINHIVDVEQFTQNLMVGFRYNF